LVLVVKDAAVLKAALANPQVTAAFRRIQTGGLLSNREGAFPLSIVGIEPEAEAPVSLVAENVVDGRWLTATDEDSILVGRGLADVMGLQIGDRITMVGSDAHKQNRQRTMTVVGIYDLGMPTIEKQTVYISLAEAQSLFDLRGQSTQVQVNLKNLGEESLVVDALAPALQQLDDEDRAILQLRFCGNVKLARIAEMIGAPAKPFYRRVEDLMHVLRTALRAHGVSDADVLAIIEHPDSGLGAVLEGAVGGKTGERPSVP